MKNAMSKRVIALVMMGSMMGTTVAQAAEVKKDESVYVTLGSTGNLEKTIVSDWIHSEESGITVFDKSELKNIKNVKSDVTPEKNGENLIWDMDGNNLYYQGTTNKDVPLDVSIKYYYEDEEIDPEDLAGKSGKVKIEIDVKNKEYKEVDINGKKRKIYTPFVVAGEVTLPNDKFKDVSVEGATTISEGNNILVAFAKMPGLSESLALDSIPFDKANEIKNKADILNDKKIVVEADAEEFSLGPIMITATADTSMLGDLEGAADLAEYKDKLEQLQSNFDLLLNGSNQLKDGIVGGYAEAKSEIVKSLPKVSGMLSLMLDDNKLNRSRQLLADAEYAKELPTESARDMLAFAGSPQLDNYIKELPLFINQGKAALKDYDKLNGFAKSTKSVLNDKKLMGEMSLLLNDVAALEKVYNSLNPQTKQVLNAISSIVTPENIMAIEGTLAKLTPAQETLKAAIKNAGGAENFIASLRTAVSTLGALSQVDFKGISKDVNSYGSAYLIIRAELKYAKATAEMTSKPEIFENKKKELKGIVAGVYSMSPQLVSQLTAAIDGFSQNLTDKDIVNDCKKAEANKTTLESLGQGVQTLQALTPLLGQLDALTLNQKQAAEVLNILAGNDQVVAQLQGLAKAMQSLSKDQQASLISMVNNLGTMMNHIDNSKTSIDTIKSMIGDKGLSEEEIKKFNMYADEIVSAEETVNKLKKLEIPDSKINGIIANKNNLLEMGKNLMDIQDRLKLDEDILNIMNNSLQQNNVNEFKSMLAKVPEKKAMLDMLNDKIQEFNNGMNTYKEQGISVIYNKGNDALKAVDELSLVKDEITKVSKDYGCFSGQDESVKGSTKFIMKTKEIKYEAPKEEEKKEETTEKKGFFAWIKSLLGID